MRMLPIASLGLAVLLLSGCLPQSPTVLPTPQPSSTPVFASDEEALAAAEAAYAEYLRVSDLVAQDGGANAERMSEVVTAEWLPKELEVFGSFAGTGNRQLGATKLSKVELQQLVDSGDGLVDLTMYVCTDFSMTSFIDAAGKDVTPSDRPAFASLVVSFQVEEATTGQFKLSNSEPWTADSVC